MIKPILYNTKIVSNKHAVTMTNICEKIIVQISSKHKEPVSFISYSVFK